MHYSEHLGNFILLMEEVLNKSAILRHKRAGLNVHSATCVCVCVVIF